jgi:flagellar FliL protein
LGEGVAEEKAVVQEVASSSPAPSGQKPVLFIILAIVNMAVVAGVGFMVWQGKKKEAAEPKIEHVIKGEAETQASEAKTEKEFVGRVVPLETFIVNLAGTKGRKVAKVNIELELKDLNGNVADEIDKRKAQVRDIIIILLSAKSYEEVSTREGKDNLRAEIKDTINSFLTKGKISSVYFTEFIYN